MSWRGEQESPGIKVAFLELRSVAEQVACDYCHAAIGETCTNGSNHLAVENYPAHNDRIKKARG